jgi:hypothetical protein
MREFTNRLNRAGPLQVLEIELVPASVQLVLTRQDEKERKQSDDGRRWPDDSYSPRRHWCSILKPDR